MNSQSFERLFAERCYVMSVPDALMSPRYKPGDAVFVDQNEPCEAGDDVVVDTHDGRTLLRRLMAVQAEEVRLDTLMGDAGVWLPTAMIRRMAYAVHPIARKRARDFVATFCAPSVKSSGAAIGQ